MQDAGSPWVFRQLAEARVFWLDWAFGLAVAAHLPGGRRVAEAAGRGGRSGRGAAWDQPPPGLR